MRPHASPQPVGDARRLAVTLRAGFTLIEMVIVVALLALIAGSLVPVITRPYIAEYQAEASNEMADLLHGIYGDPANGQYGFVGDIGATGTDPIGLLTTATPGAPNDLEALLVRPTTPAVVATTKLGIASDTPPDPGVVQGWAGPYLHPHYPLPTTDPWGQPYLIETKPGDVSQWHLLSTGPDRQKGTADDIVFPSNDTPTPYFKDQGVLVVDVWATNGEAAWQVPAGSAANWNVTLSPSTTNCTALNVAHPDGQFQCPSVYFGAHHLKITDTLTSAVVADQNVVVSAPYTYAKVFWHKGGTATAIPGTPAMAGLNYACLPTPLPGAPTGTVCSGTGTALGYATVTYTGQFTPASTDECVIQVWADLGSGATRVGNPIYVGDQHYAGATEILPFTLSVPVNLSYLTNSATGWKLHLQAVKLTDGTACVLGSTPTASDFVMLNHP